MFPESLVTIRSYGTADEAHAAVAALDAEGIVSYARVHGHGRGGGASAFLSVAESDAERARRILGPAPDEGVEDGPDAADDEFACPRCRSTRGKTLPPYYLIALIAFLGVGLWLASRYLWTWTVALTVVGSLVLHRIGARVPHWRCLNCGHAWNHDAERRRRADARRNAND